MGNCCFKPKNPGQHKLENPSNGAKHPKLQLQVALRDFSLRLASQKKVPKSMSIEASVCGQLANFEDLKAIGAGYTWTEERVVSVNESYEDLSTKDLSLVFREGKKVIGFSDISFLSIVEGPALQSFPMLQNQKSTGRVSFTAEILEETQVSVTLREAKCFLNETYRGKWSVSFKIIAEDVFESSDSYVTDSTKWIFADDHLTKESPPSVTFKGTIASIRDASIKIRIWTHSGNEIERAGEAWLSFSKLYKEEMHSLYRSKSEIGSDFRSLRKGSDVDKSDLKNFKENMWISGKKVGLMSGSLKVSGLPSIQQIIGGVNTENGVLLDSPTHINEKRTYFGSSLPEEIKKINEHTQRLIKSMLRKNAFNDRAACQKRKDSLLALIGLLNSKHHHAKPLFFYEGTADLIKAQHILINLADHLIERALLIPYEVKALYFENLLLVMKRSELELASLSFQGPDESKVEVGVRFRAMTHKALKLALSRMVYKGLHQNIADFTHYMLAISWFRVPKFRELMSKLLFEKSDGEVDQFMCAHLELDENTVLLPTIDWQDNFEAFLPEESFDVLQEEAWRDKIKKRGLVFFEFIVMWIEYVSLNHQPVFWKTLPEYSSIVKGFMLEMKERDVKQYPDKMVEAGGKLLENPDLFNSFTCIVFSKTNAYDYMSVSECYSVLTKWFSVVFKKTLLLDWEFFIKGIKITMNSEVGINVGKTLQFIYYNYHIFRKDMRKDLIGKVLMRKLKDLVLHWSVEVRTFVFNLVFYRIFSIEYLKFEPQDEWHEYDLSLIKSVKKKIKAIWKEEDSPYVERAKKEYKEAYAKYEKWKENLPDDNLLTDEPNTYGFFIDFPYPNFNLKVFKEDENIDKFEDW